MTDADTANRSFPAGVAARPAATHGAVAEAVEQSRHRRGRRREDYPAVSTSPAARSPARAAPSMKLGSAEVSAPA